MEFSNEKKVGLFFIGGILLFVAFIEATVGTGLLQSRYSLWAEFDDVGGLTVGAPVRVAGVPAGDVEEIVLEKDRVRVRLTIDESIPVRKNARAKLEFQLLSGSGFVTITLGAPEAGNLEPGDTIDSEEPTNLFAMVSELEDVAQSIRQLADSLNDNQEMLLTNVNRMLEENRESFRQTMGNFSVITSEIAEGKGTLGRLLHDPALYDEAVLTLTSLRSTLDDVNLVTTQLASGDGTLGRLLYDDVVYDEFRSTLASLEVTARNAEDISDRIRLGEGTLGRLLVEEALYLEAEEAVRSLTRASQGIEDQAPISVLGTLIGTMF